MTGRQNDQPSIYEADRRRHIQESDHSDGRNIYTHTQHRTLPQPGTVRSRVGTKMHHHAALPQSRKSAVYVDCNGRTNIEIHNIQTHQYLKHQEYKGDTMGMLDNVKNIEITTHSFPYEIENNVYNNYSHQTNSSPRQVITYQSYKQDNKSNSPDACSSNYGSPSIVSSGTTREMLIRDSCQKSTNAIDYHAKVPVKEAQPSQIRSITTKKQSMIVSHAGIQNNRNQQNPRCPAPMIGMQNNAISMSDSIGHSSSAVETTCDERQQFNTSLTSDGDDSHAIIQYGCSVEKCRSTHEETPRHHEHRHHGDKSNRKQRKRLIKNPKSNVRIARILEILEDRRIKDPSELGKLQDLQLPMLRKVLNITFVALGVCFLLSVIILIIREVVLEMAPSITL